MLNDKSGNLYNVDGDPVELNDVQRISLVCFKCTNYIKDNLALLLSPFEVQSSDSVATRETVYLCKSCYNEVMRFCGSVEN